MFPTEYFQLIVHNQALEHTLGSSRVHLDELHRLLATGGVMAFAIPDFRIKKGQKQTTEAGKLLASEANRLREHGQGDHYKAFGTDLIGYIQAEFSEFEALL